MFTANFARPISTAVSAALLSLALGACSSSDTVASAPAFGAPAKLELSASAVALGGIGAADTIKATVRDDQGRVLSAAVSWTSADPAVAEVDAQGVLVGRAAGTTQLRASSGELTAEVEVRVLGVRGLALSAADLTVRVGDTQLIGAIIDSDPSANQTVTFESLNPAVASVDENGVVTALAPGSASIKVSAAADPRIAVTAMVKVNPARTVFFAPGSEAVTLTVGEARRVTASADVDESDTKDVIWSSGNTAIATVTEDGLLTAVAEGTALIRVTSAADPRAYAELLLTVVPETAPPRVSARRR